MNRQPRMSHPSNMKRQTVRNLSTLAQCREKMDQIPQQPRDPHKPQSLHIAQTPAHLFQTFLCLHQIIATSWELKRRALSDQDLKCRSPANSRMQEAQLQTTRPENLLVPLEVRHQPRSVPTGVIHQEWFSPHPLPARARCSAQEHKGRPIPSPDPIPPAQQHQTITLKPPS